MLGITKKQELFAELSGFKAGSTMYLHKAELCQLLSFIAEHGFDRCKAGLSFGFITEWVDVPPEEFVYSDDSPFYSLHLKNFELKLGSWDGWECYDRAAAFPDERSLVITLENHICSAPGTSRVTLEITLPAHKAVYFSH
ncbi:hypothetical protein [Mesobacillus zeae]|uniref:Uncharacterized protein n=1 Tax=Mesobacillus zeae TaxID=1917180 RepID=A0A398B391_9BACI|nr:hypothetical protein [Mesobacillus zeae]RID84429.1 hypothetical protein D1970_12920 [Mesobacillus zeae]